MTFSLFPFSIHLVKGHSMLPALNEGDRIVAFRWAYLFSQPKKGDVVVFKGSDGKDYVKRVTTAEKNIVTVSGDNKADSRKLPKVGRNSIIGKVIMKY